MIRSKLFALSKALVRNGNGKRQFSTTTPNLSNFSYRDLPSPDKHIIIMAEVAGAYMWWWILWHVFTDYEHIIGHFPFPDSSAWTDEELGVPPDNMEN